MIVSFSKKMYMKKLKIFKATTILNNKKINQQNIFNNKN